ncbi:hypothetical protein BT96DRAFT_840005 [Gymnopus androsaceus JB14]|uniref:SWIM-type domain-containing protein n=1 Tax=Gymnopus androsaceus JB14 TaxID=1447944 RepID=A0A6A4GKL9_9AGAR|nr:hypothetical protein BT96DRAFT_840005 [Gymnopus androsaceus JB14]
MLKNPHWIWKIASKQSNCQCFLKVKTYHNTSVVLANYTNAHNHCIGNTNLPYTHISKATREWIAGRLGDCVEPKYLLNRIHQDAMGNEDKLYFESDSHLHNRNEFITLADILRIQKGIRAETIHLDSDDAHSIQKWVAKLRSQGHLLWPAFLLASNNETETLTFYLKTLCACHPDIHPDYFMLDCDQSMINALCIVYPLVFLLLCWWHVLHAWQQHFSTTAYPELWEKLKAWIRVTDTDTFNSMKAEIFVLAPQSFHEYLGTYWLTDSFLPMWSAAYRTKHSIFQDINTNMITEVYHHCKRQDFGFKGLSIEVWKHKDVILHSQSIMLNDIEAGNKHHTFSIISCSQPGVAYTVDMIAYTCNCPDFPLINFCKHVCAFQCLFPRAGDADSIGDTSTIATPPLPALSMPN